MVAEGASLLRMCRHHPPCQQQAHRGSGFHSFRVFEGHAHDYFNNSDHVNDQSEPWLNGLSSGHAATAISEVRNDLLETKSLRSLVAMGSR
jgi:hypothetical protein